MAIVRNGDYALEDFTQVVNKVPRTWNILDNYISVNEFGVTTETVQVDVVTERTETFGDSRRGGQRNSVGAESYVTKHLSTTFFTLDGAVQPSDIQNLRMVGTEQSPMTEEAAIEKISTRIMRFHSALRTKAIVEAIKGTNYVPNGTTEAYNYYSVFGVTKKQIPFDLANPATDPISKIEEGIAHIQDTANDGGDSYNMLVLCSPEFFSALLANDILHTSFMYYQSTQEPLRDRQGGNSIVRRFTYGGAEFVEYRGAFSATGQMIPAGKAYMMPVGVEGMFNIAYSPADHLDYVNTVGEKAYLWVERTPRRASIQSETAFIAYNTRPELVVELTKDASF